MMPLERRLSTLSPRFGTYAAKTWSKLRFSPMITITCLIGDAVFPSFEAPGCACAAGKPIANCAMASNAAPVRNPRRAPETARLSVMQAPFLATIDSSTPGWLRELALFELHNDLLVMNY